MLRISTAVLLHLFSSCQRHRISGTLSQHRPLLQTISLLLDVRSTTHCLKFCVVWQHPSPPQAMMRHRRNPTIGKSSHDQLFCASVILSSAWLLSPSLCPPHPYTQTVFTPRLLTLYFLTRLFCACHTHGAPTTRLWFSIQAGGSSFHRQLSCASNH